MVTHNAFQNLIISFSPGERVFTEGEVGTTMFIVQSGRVRLFREGGGKAVAIAEMEKGDFFGEMSLLEATPRNMSAEAIDGVELIEINSTTFDRMIRSNIEIAVRMLRKLSGRLQKAESLLGAQRAAQSDHPVTAAPGASAPVAAAPVAAAPKPSRPSAPTVVPAAAPSGPARARPRPTSVPLSGAVGSTTSTPAAAAVAPPDPAPIPAAAAAAAVPASLSATRPPAAAVAEAAPSAPAVTATVTATAPRPAPSIAVPAAPRGATAQGARLVSENGETVFPIAQGDAMLGRYDPVTETQPEVDLTLIDIKRSVSRRHARISTRDGVYFLTEEVGALNGTFVNGVKLITGKPAPLNNEDRVSLGTVNLVFRS